MITAKLYIPTVQANELSSATYFDFNSNFGFKRAVEDQIIRNNSVRNEIVSIVKKTVDDYCVVELDIDFGSHTTHLYCN